jgi:hypothetical protein
MSQKRFIAMGPDGQEFKVSLFRSAEIQNQLPKILYICRSYVMYTLLFANSLPYYFINIVK